MIYTHSNTAPATFVLDEHNNRISYVEKVDTDTNTLTIFCYPFSTSHHEDNLDTFERKFTRIEVLPTADFPNTFHCYGEIL